MVLTHGFTLDENGRKMSKSVGNTVEPQKVMKQSGADILRLWVCATDYADDQRIGPEILKNTIETYRKLRNSIRWMLGTLHHFKPDDAVALAEMPELERLMLHQLAEQAAIVRKAYAEFDYKTVVASLAAFMNTELSAFYFDIRKDTLYCDPPSSLARKAALTAIDMLCDAILKWLAPVLSFTTEEAWRMYRPDAEPSVHLTLFPRRSRQFRDDALAAKWEIIRNVRRVVTGALEVERAAKRIGSSLEASPVIYVSDRAIFATLFDIDLAEVCITSNYEVRRRRGPGRRVSSGRHVPGVAVVVEKAVGTKCARSWKILPTVGSDPEYPDVSPRDAQALREWKALGVRLTRVVPNAGTHNPAENVRDERRLSEQNRHGVWVPAFAGRRWALCGAYDAHPPASPPGRAGARPGLKTLAAVRVRHRPPRRGQRDAVFRSGAGLESRDQLRLVPERQPGRPGRPDGGQGRGGDRAGGLDGAVAHPDATLALGLIIGGAIGNAIDRFAYGAVVDFALFHVQIGGNTYNWYVFNLADVAIVAGVAALLYDSFLGVPAAKAP